MPAFVITGDGHPAYAVLKAVHETPGTSIAAFVPGSSSAVKATTYAKNNAITILPRTMLMGKEPLPQSLRADWLVIRPAGGVVGFGQWHHLRKTHASVGHIADMTDNVEVLGAAPIGGRG